MTPQEKAKELVNKYLAIQFGDFPTTEAKQCALIAVNEIINYLTTSLDIQTSLSAVNYWYTVKQEIQKL